jgi:NAD+ kinase
MDKVKKAVIFVNPEKNNSGTVLEEIKSQLQFKNIAVTVFSYNNGPEKPQEGEWDIAFSLGGDGTVLYTARSLAGTGIPILPVNCGTLGFIAGINRNNWLKTFNGWADGSISLSRRCMLKISVIRENIAVMESTCLNDAVISATGIARLIRLDVHSSFSGNEKTKLGSYRCDGLIIATPTGSTAYSMAAGGPILDPEMEAIILNPICPFTLSNRPLVLHSKQGLEVTVVREQRSGVLLTLDGQDTFNMEWGDKIVIEDAPWRALLISVDRRTYYSALRTKLSWSGSIGDAANNSADAGGGKDA